MHGVGMEIRQPQVFQQLPAIRVRIGAHAAFTFWGNVSEFRFELALWVKELLWAIAFHPMFKNSDMIRILVHLSHRYLLRPPVALDLATIDLCRACPSLGGFHDNHGPARASGRAVVPRLGLDAANLTDDAFECGSHQWVHLVRFMPFDKVRHVAVASDQFVEFLVSDASQYAWVCDLVTIQVQDRKNSSIPYRVQKFVRVPRCGERARFSFPIPDDRGDNQVWIIECGTVCMRQCVSQFAAFMDGAWCFWRNMAGNTSRKRELFEQPFHPCFVRRDVRINLAISAFEVRVGNQSWPSVPRTGDTDHVEIVLLDDSVEMGVDKVQSRCC